jgi:adenosylmethionine---8-amino-7-oxononanoate aminotransferase
VNLIDRDKKFIWHPFTQMKVADAPIHIESGKGAMLFGSDGKSYIDAISSWWVNIHGHGNAYIASKIAEQATKLEQVIFAGFTHTPAITLAERLIQLLPAQFSKVFFSDNGSTCVEVAVKMALQYWYNQGVTKKTILIALENAYHGDTFGAMSVSGKSTFNKPFQKHLFEVVHIPIPTDENINQVVTQLRAIAKGDNVAAFIFEPLIQGAAGMLMYKPTHLNTLISVAKENNILCIADEVMTGFGRTGKLFAINYLEQKPDIICLSKGITGGFMPLGITICTENIFQAFYSDEKQKAFFHGHSYTANPLACAAANASLDLLVMENCQHQIDFIASSHAVFAQKIMSNESVKNIRQQGTVLAFEINTQEGTSYFNAISKEAYTYFISKGVLLRPLGNVIYIMPPYCITQKELEAVYAVIKEFLTKIKLPQ